jgi:hypothetical protein
VRDTITPDHTAIQVMLEELFLPYAEWPEHRLEACCIWHDKDVKRPIPARHFTAKEIPETAAWLAEMNATPGWNIYIGAGLRHDRAPRRKRANKGHVELTRWIWADFDAEGTAEAARGLLAGIDFTPTFWVETGTRPFQRWHAWWQLEEALTGQEAEGLMARMIEALKADPAPKSRAGVMRLAGGVTWPKVGKQDRVAEMVTRHAGSGRAYGKAEVLALVDMLDPPKPKPTPRAKARGRAAMASRASSAKIAEALRWIDPDAGYQDWLRVGMALHDAGEPIDTWDAWSQRSQSYDWHEVETKWASFGKTSGGLTIGTLFHMAGQAGADLAAIARMGLPEATQKPAGRQEGLPVAEARVKLQEVVQGFLTSREHAPIQMVNATLGLGKTAATLRMVADAVKARRAAGDGDAVVALAAPMHRLSDQMAEDFQRIAPDLKAAVLRGPEADDPDHPGQPVCKRLDAYREASALLLDPESEVCRTCPVRASCRVMTDKLVKADVYIVAHQALAGKTPVERKAPPAWWMAEHVNLTDRRAAAQIGMKAQLDALAARRKEALAGLTGEKRLAAVADFKRQREAILTTASDAVAEVKAEKAEGKRPREGQRLLFTVVDEDPLGALMFGTDLPRSMGIAGWLAAPAGASDGEAEQLTAARRWLARVVTKNGVGPLRLESVLAGGGDDFAGIGPLLGRLHAEAAAKLEWHRKQPKDAGKDMLAHNRTVRTCAAIWREIVGFLATGAESTGRLEVVADAEKGVAIRHVGVRRVQDGWKAGGLLLLDATGRAEVAEALLNEKVLVHEVTAAQPMLRVVQDASRAFGKAMLVATGWNDAADKAARNNVARLHAWVTARAAEVAPRQLGLVTYKAVIESLQETGLPDNVVMGWFGNLRGMNSMQDVAAMVQIGRPLPEEHGLGRMAAALTGRPVNGRYVLDGEAKRLVAAAGGLWWQEGVSACHPDPMAQTLLEAIRDGESMQAIGRPRAVNRTEPVTVWVLSDAVLSCPVELANIWDEVVEDERDPIGRQMAAGGIAFTSAAHAARAYPEMWRSKQAASKSLTGQLSLYKTLCIRKVDQSCPPIPLEYRIPRAKDSCTVLVDTSRHPDPVAALLDVLPEAVDVRVIASPEGHKPLVTAHNEAAKALESMVDSSVEPADSVSKGTLEQAEAAALLRKSFARLATGIRKWKSTPTGRHAIATHGRWTSIRAVAAPP